MSDESENQVTVKYPECTVELSGVDANAVLIFRKVRRELIKHLDGAGGMTRAEAEAKGDEFQAEATSGDYDHVLVTCHLWVTVV